MDRWLSARGILLGTLETAALPALLAATPPDATGPQLYGPSGPGHLGGAPAAPSLYRPIAHEDGARLREVSETLTRTALPTG